jgi:hypothetical protein
MTLHFKHVAVWLPIFRVAYCQTRDSFRTASSSKSTLSLLLLFAVCSTVSEYDGIFVGEDERFVAAWDEDWLVTKFEIDDLFADENDGWLSD